jgi:hypothetical protein
LAGPRRGRPTHQILAIGITGPQGAFSRLWRPPMQSFALQTYCLALLSPQRAESHLRVGEFPAAERAFELAELMALEFGIDVEKNWSGWTIEVRCPQGRKLFAAPVGNCLEAAI